jgi:hypothetical protein
MIMMVAVVAFVIMIMFSPVAVIFMVPVTLMHLPAFLVVIIVGMVPASPFIPVPGATVAP